MRRLDFVTVEAFAQCCAELTRQGTAFTGGETVGGLFFVILTGY